MVSGRNSYINLLSLLLGLALSGCGFVQQKVSEEGNSVLPPIVAPFTNTGQNLYYNSSTYGLSWALLRGSSVTYTVKVYNSANCSGIPTTTTTQSTGFYNVGGMIDGQIYSVKIVATNSFGTSNSVCSPNLVIDLQNPDPPTFILPAGNITIGAVNYTFTWNVPVDNGVSGLAVINTYMVENFNNGTCTGAAVSSTNTTLTSYNRTGISNGNTYSLRLTSYDSAGNISATICSAAVTVNTNSPAVLAFDSPAQPSNIVGGGISDITYTVTNSGGSTATGMSFSGLAAPYTNAGGTCGATLASGLTCTYIVRFTSPGAGTYNDTLILDYNDSVGAQQITTNLSATGVVGAATVAAVYATHSNWNDYVKNDDGASDTNHQDDVACVGNETGFLACVHGGERRKAVLTGVTSCTGITAVDSLAAFDWSCTLDSGTAVVYSDGLKSGKGLRDLVNAASWKNIQLTVSQSGSTIWQSVATTWWTNPVVALPDNSAGTVIALDGVDDDGAGPDDVYAAGTVLTLASSQATNGYNINMDGLSLVTLTGATLSYAGGAANTSAIGEVSNVNVTVVAAGTQKFIWVEADVDSEGGVVDAEWGIYYSRVKFSVISGSSVTHSTAVEVNVSEGQSNILRSSTATGGGTVTTAGILINVSPYTWLKNLTATGNAAVGVYCYYCDYSRIEDITANSNGTEGLKVYGDFNGGIVQNVSATSNDNGVYLYGAGATTAVTVQNITATNNITNGVYTLGMGLINIDTLNMDGNKYGVIMNGPFNGTYQNFYSKNSNFIGIGYYSSAGPCIIKNMYAANTAGTGFHLDDTRNFKVYNVKSYNSGGHGVSVASGTHVGNNYLSQILAVNSGITGMNISGNSNTNVDVNFVTSVNSATGIVVNNSTNATVNNALTVNNSDAGFTSSLTTNAIFSQIATANNVNSAVYSFNAVSAKFTNNILVGSSGVECAESGGTAPGITHGLNGACAVADTSNANFLPGYTFAASFVGKLTADDTTNTELSHLIAYATTIDWFNFENPFRAWGMNGGAFPAANNQGRCSVGNCLIWDWSLASGDNLVRNRSGNGGANNAFVAGATCPAEVHGNVAMADAAAANTFLINAMEVNGDSIGDDDGLCESNEACIYAPNFGAYQGHGTLTAACTFQNGTVTGVTMYAYPTNGR